MRRRQLVEIDCKCDTRCQLASAFGPEADIVPATGGSGGHEPALRRSYIALRPVSLYFDRGLFNEDRTTLLEH